MYIYTQRKDGAKQIFASSYPPPDADCARRAIEVGVAKKLLIERGLRGRGAEGSSRKL